jgi:hypothetical protein
LQSGLDPADVAGLVISAIEARRLYLIAAAMSRFASRGCCKVFHALAGAPRRQAG